MLPLKTIYFVMIFELYIVISAIPSIQFPLYQLISIELGVKRVNYLLHIQSIDIFKFKNALF